MYTTSMTAFLAAAIIGHVAAFPQYADKVVKRQDDHQWIGPGPGDARSPCPGTNTLANHGYINRNGRGVTRQQYQQGFLDAFGFEFAITDAGSQNAINLQGNGNTFDLDTLNQPHQIEHDGSLTRNDLQMEWNQNADNHDFNNTVWCETQFFYGGGDHVDPVAANTARLGRVQEAQNEDFPGWFVQNDGGSFAEAGFYLTAMQDPAVGGISARLEWLNYWFTNERLPTELGWVRPAVSNDQFNAAVQAVQGAQTTVPPGTNTCGTPQSTSSSSSSSSVSTSASASTTSGPTGSISSTSSYPTAPSYRNTTSSSSAPAGYTTSTPGGTATTPAAIATVQPAVTSAAKATATAMAGSPPQVPNGYTTVICSEDWDTVATIVETYVYKVEQIVLSLCGLQGLGSIVMPGASGPGASAPGNAPWYGGMGSSAPGSPAPAPAPALPGSPAATCACK